MRKLFSVAFGVLCLAAVGCVDQSSTVSNAQSSLTGETHPFQSQLLCKRAPGSTLVGVMYDTSSGVQQKITQFSSGGNVGACELAIRAARNSQVCVTKGWSGYGIRDLETGDVTGQYSSLSACTAETRGHPELATENGYLDIIAPDELAPFRAALPPLGDSTIDAVLHGANTIWYDESSFVFTYQDSFGNPKGLRANRVGYDVGSTNSHPDIRALTEYFKLQKFKFPFAVTAGATFHENVYAQYFWSPPVDEDGDVIPVRVWKNASHWQWVFPTGTVMGEVLHIQAPDDGQWFAFEVRSRTRTLTGWDTGIFRPYVQATNLATAIKTKRPTWQQVPALTALVEHLEADDSLTPHTMTAPNYEALFPALDGAMDYLPDADDTALIKELLSGVTFQDAMGQTWKHTDALTTFAASTQSGFHIVPKDYPAGMFENSENGCRMCHEQTSRPLNNLDPRVVLYGEVWGEDEIFTWHPFGIDTSAFGVANGNRYLNPRFSAAGLVQMGAPSVTSTTYKALPKPYVTAYE